jgi:hypothetical protein
MNAQHAKIMLYFSFAGYFSFLNSMLYFSSMGRHCLPIDIIYFPTLFFALLTRLSYIS